MSQLRARQPQQKAERRADILACTLNLWRTTPFTDLKMSDVARQAGLAKGTLYLYFATKEELFLELLESRLYPWMQQLAVQLRALRPATPFTVAKLCRQALESDPELNRLLPLLESVLELGISTESAEAFKTRLLANVLPLGEALEHALPRFIAPGQGPQAVVALRALHTGFRQMADAAPVVREALDRNPHLAPLRVDFARDFESALARLLAGFAAMNPNNGKRK